MISVGCLSTLNNEEKNPVILNQNITMFVYYDSKQNVI